MGDMTLKQVVDLIPTIGIVGAILAGALLLGNRRKWMFIWVYDEMRTDFIARLAEKDEQIKMWEQRYDELNDMWKNINSINLSVADKALDKKK